MFWALDYLQLTWPALGHLTSFRSLDHFSGHSTSFTSQAATQDAVKYTPNISNTP